MRRAPIVLLGALLLAGCGADEGIDRGGAVIGDTLTVYSSLPDPSAGADRDIADGEKLALAQRGGRAGEFGVNFALMDEVDDDPTERRERAADVAREIVRDPQVIAAIGAERSETARTMVPLIDAAGVLLVSPGAGDPALTADPRYAPSGRRTFARAVGDDRAQAPALLAAARAAGARRVAVEHEPTPDGQALAAELRRLAGARLEADAAQADAVIYAGEDAVNAAGVADGLPRGMRIVLPDAVVRAGVERRLTPAARTRAVFVSAAPRPGSTPELRRFEADFSARFGRPPGPYAAVGHAAMNAVLDAIAAAGSDANERQAVIDAFFAGRPGGAPAFTAYRLRGARREYLVAR
jgi:ABC-type branched-subunit amino acid transport system substrate-binding protein